MVAQQAREPAVARRAREPAFALDDGRGGDEEDGVGGAGDDAVPHLLQSACVQPCRVARSVSFATGSETLEFEVEDSCKLRPPRSRRSRGKLEDVELVENPFGIRKEFRVEQWADIDDADE